MILLLNKKIQLSEINLCLVLCKTQKSSLILFVFSLYSRWRIHCFSSYLSQKCHINIACLNFIIKRIVHEYYFLLNFFDELGKNDKMQGLSSIVSLFNNEFNKKYKSTNVRFFFIIYPTKKETHHLELLGHWLDMVYLPPGEIL